MSSPRVTFDATPGSTHELVVGLVPPRARVLEFGCASGYMSRVLKTRLGCRVVGVELFAESAEQALPHCERLLIGDVETMDLGATLGGERFDAILFADVLEHLRQPEAVLRRLRPLLAEGGVVVASLPNVAHASVRLALLGGEFRYADGGLLDRTHVRFFTRESIEDLFEGAGYTIDTWARRRRSAEQSEVLPPARPVPEAITAWLREDPEATTYQFVVRAAPSAAAEANLRARLQRRQAENAARWAERVRRAWRELDQVVAPGQPFILIDEEALAPQLGPPLCPRPFVEREGRYHGPPADDAAAIEEVERQRRAGAELIVVAWPAFWWLEYYTGLAAHLARYRRVLASERFIVHDLRTHAG